LLSAGQKMQTLSMAAIKNLIRVKCFIRSLSELGRGKF
jgi:hypothetical protein